MNVDPIDPNDTSIAPGDPIASLSVEFNDDSGEVQLDDGGYLDNEGHLDEVETDDWGDDDEEYVEQYDYLGEIIHSIKLYEKFSAPPGERVDHDLSTTTLHSTRLVKVSQPATPENTPDSPSPDHPQPTGLIHSAALTRHSQGLEIIKVVVPEGSDAIPQPTDRSGEDVVDGEFWDEVSTE